jgi:hypothetical protein
MLAAAAIDNSRSVTTTERRLAIGDGYCKRGGCNMVDMKSRDFNESAYYNTFWES